MSNYNPAGATMPPLVDPIVALRDEVEKLIRAAYPLPSDPAYDEGRTSETTEFRVRHTDGVVRNISPREVITAHREGLKVEQRKVWVTEWELVTR